MRAPRRPRKAAKTPTLLFAPAVRLVTWQFCTLPPYVRLLGPIDTDVGMTVASASERRALNSTAVVPGPPRQRRRLGPRGALALAIIVALLAVGLVFAFASEGNGSPPPSQRSHVEADR